MKFIRNIPQNRHEIAYWAANRGGMGRFKSPRIQPVFERTIETFAYPDCSNYWADSLLTRDSAGDTMKQVSSEKKRRKGYNMTPSHGGENVPESSYGSPVLLKNLKEQFSTTSSQKIEMRESKDVEKFLKKKREWEKQAKSQPILQFK
jgi:hypothetical protein